jgi:hypothetical protein
MAICDVAVDPLVEPIHQPSPMTCWAAAGTMMAAWKARAPLTTETVLDQAGGAWRAKYDSDQGLSAAELRAFTVALGLREEGPSSYSVEGLARLLESAGPLWVVSDDDFEDNAVVHAWIVVAVKGDGTDAGTQVTLADPLADPATTGGLVIETFAQFAQRLERHEAAEFGVGVFHH